MTLEEFLLQYMDTNKELSECENRLLELEWPQRGNQIAKGEHAGVSNQPEEYAVLRDKLERKIAYLKVKLKRSKRSIEAFLKRLHPRTAKLLRRKYIEGLNTKEIAAWMHVQDKSANDAIKNAIKKSEPEYIKFLEERPKKPEGGIIKEG